MPKTVLLIDYDPRSFARIRDLLDASGYRTVVAQDGLTGIEEFERLEPDVTLIQDLLPKRHGFDVCRDLKSTERGRRACVLVITSPHRGLRHQLFQTGCDAHLEKPFADEALIEAVGKLTTVGESRPGEAAPSDAEASGPQEAELRAAGGGAGGGR